MSFFKKTFANVDSIFKKNGSSSGGGNSFFRKGGGLDQFSVALRKGGNTFATVADVIRGIASNPLLVESANIIGAEYGNPLLGDQMAEGGKGVADGADIGSKIMLQGRELTNRKRYNNLERA